MFLACSRGYHGNDCAIKCQYPTYGESCQSECKCLKNECHYSQGCILHTTIDNEYKRPSMSKCFSILCNVETVTSINWM